MRVLVYENITAGDLGDDVPASLRSEGAAMLHAVADDFARIPGVEVLRNAPIDADYDGTLVIAPEFDDHLHRLSQAVLDRGGCLLGSLPDAIHLTADKLALANFWLGTGVPHPRTALLHQLDLDAWREPWVLKPRFGAGSQATFLIRHPGDERDALLAALAERPDDDFLAQEYIAGQAASVALLIGREQVIPLAPCMQNLSADGRFHYHGGSLPLPAPLAERATRLALRAAAGIAGLQGYVGVDLVLADDGRDVVIEINPRITTSYLGLRQLCRENLAPMILRCVSGESLSMPMWHARAVTFHPGGG